MAGLFYPTTDNVFHLLDPGAGIGSLSGAFLEHHFSGNLTFSKVAITAFEFDNLLHNDLENTLASYAKQGPLSYEIIGSDFIEEAVNRIQFDNAYKFSHAILNPPYKKISSDSRHRLLLRQVGIETVNLYSAFVALTLKLMAPRGQVVAIIPRSFCNGPYYRPFRNLILDRAAIRQIHLFESRNTPFKDDGVLQENIIISLECGAQQGDVTVTTSTDDSFADLATHIYPFDRIVLPDDPERFVHVPTTPKRNAIELSAAVRYSLEELDIQVSTGPVVDFRMKDYLRNKPEPGSVPLLYPGHFNGQNTEWPKLDMKKPNALLRNIETEKWLFPTGYYCVVRRFSSKEEKRRIMASIVQPNSFPGADVLGFENHLNVFHEHKHGLPETLARGLSVFLNSTAVDECFRSFNGHTQVNATDLKLMKYPSRRVLMALGEKVKNLLSDQQTIDNLVKGLQEA
ncbi:MAG: Eco57I restriction-modification methylase domain-containing protein [Nitrosomonas sp.]|nr:Eco57I restriction-modification methylase domain-containing protein [Nitrosomonas sp.]